MGPRVAVTTVAVAAALAGLGPAAGQAAPGEVDTSFGQGGFAVIAVGVNNARVVDAAVQPDGKIVLAGHAFQDGPSSDAAIVIMRLNSDGSVDGGFGNGGSITFNLDNQPNGFDVANGVAIGPDGKIAVGGTTQAGPSFGNTDVVVIQLTAQGQPDMSFGTAGVETRSLTPAGNDQALDIIVQPNSAIVTSGANGTLGFSLLRFEADGDPDLTWDGDGEANVTFGGPEADSALTLVQQPDGKIVAGGSADISTGAAGDFAIARFLESNGALDPDFGTGGRVTTPGPNNERLTNLALGPAGRIFALGVDIDLMTFNTDMVVSTYSANGTMDATFGGDGRAEGGFTFGDPGGLIARADGGGTVVGAAVGTPSNNFDVSLWDFDPFGAPNTTYRNGGKAFQPVGPDTDTAATAVTQPIPGGNGAQRLIAAGVTFQAGREQFMIGAFKIADETTGPPPPPPNGGTTPPPRARDLDFDVELTLRALERARNAFPVIGDELEAVTIIGREDLREGFAVDLRGNNRGPHSPSTATWYLTLQRNLVYAREQSGLRDDCRIVQVFALTDCGPAVMAVNRPQVATVIVRGRTARPRGPVAMLGTIRGTEAGVTESNIVNNTTAMGVIALFEPGADFNRGGSDPPKLGGTVDVPEDPDLEDDDLPRVDAAGNAGRVTRLNKVARVEVAVLRTEGRARGFSGDPAAPAPGARTAGATARCSWLASARGTFRNERPRRGVCDQPRWLKGTMSRLRPRAKTRNWAFGLPDDLPAGRYVAYVRGVNRAGLADDTYSKRAKNRVEFRVR